MRNCWSTLKILLVVAALSGGCATPEDTFEQSGEWSEELSAEEQAAEPAPVSESTAAERISCRTHRDCFSSGFNFCCNNRCRDNFPGLRCLNRGGGAFE